MASHMETPPVATGGAQKCSELGAFEHSEHNPPPPNFQPLGDAAERVVADIAFRTGRRGDE
jgi:hypothetical protein